MSADDVARSSDRPEAVGSVRVCVARAALRAALGVPGVLGSDSGPSGLRLTADPAAGPLVGVSATAEADGRYAVDLSLVAEMVPLPQLAEEVRGRVRKRAQVEQLGDVLGSINVEFVYVATAEEVAAAAAEKQVEEALAAEELAATIPVAEEAAESTIPVAEEAAESTIPESGGVRRSTEATPPGPDAAALAARQAALATDQAALAAKQAALAAEQAALAALPAAALSSLESERATGSMAEDPEERER